MLNWFGIESHPTDDYIHWKDRNPRETAKKLRAAYDLIVQLGGDYEASLKMLLSVAYHAGEVDEALSGAGADI